ncbi:pre-mRNA-splicing factor CWC25 homolog [Ischnura elegans]|uniref:pre-mRNA-splicing factor CWC25 homolog n=1 Tax=Ischnura elegans TaxID=197161 RepID=UPI001ED88901|nr:pre-mRNA-splicing factor CWC25 homolog [Ischnura elegans]
MGGGDLNLKKSWHPSTMKNMEKVWKAEQRHEQEKKKIAELQREIREEREREEIRKFAEDGGVIEKKDELKLDWMYKGPGGVVSREDYLLGRAIDKSFDLLQEAEKEAAQSSSGDGRSCQGLPGRSGMLDDQVDIARKLQEDPLLLIKKKELETRTQILNNPVKLKKLQRMLKEEKLKVGKKSKKKSKKKRKRRSSSSSDDSSDGKDLDKILAAKYNRLKDRLNSVDVTKLLSDDESEENRRKDRREASTSHSHESSGPSRQRHDDSRSYSKDYGLVKPPGYERRPSSKPTSDTSDRSQRSSKPTPKPSSVPPPQQQRGQKRALTEEEMEKRRREMMDNARWRDEQRERNVRHQKEEERKEKEAEKREYDTAFLRKQLSIAASVGTVEGRIKSNINNIQRSGRSMDMNFAKR